MRRPLAHIPVVRAGPALSTTEAEETAAPWPYTRAVALLATGLAGWIVVAVGSVGLVLSAVALLCGLLFFAYAAKYYLTTAAVVIRALLGRTDRRPRDLLGRIEQLPRLPRASQPFISIHLPMYNEHAVMERVLLACTTLAYDQYEVIVCDDSTDERAIRVLDRWRRHPRVRVLHRDDRSGFKGGALDVAVRVMDPRTEYVVVFDADFVPAPDILVRFLACFGRLRPFGVETSVDDRVAAVQGYQWHVLNATENWITRGVRAEFAGSYVLERSGQELFGTMKMIAGSVFAIRSDVLRQLGWSRSITEDWELTLRLYLSGWKVAYTPHVSAPAECVSDLRKLIRQRQRWAEGHTYNVKRYFWEIIASPHVSLREKLEFVFYAPYYLQSVFLVIGTVAWIAGVHVTQARLPGWSEVLGWSLVVTNFCALPLMVVAGLFLENGKHRDLGSVVHATLLGAILAPFQGYAALQGLLEAREGTWRRTPKSGRVTEAPRGLRLSYLLPWAPPFRAPKRQPAAQRRPQAAFQRLFLYLAATVVAMGALSGRALAASGTTSGGDVIAAMVLTIVAPLVLLVVTWLRLRSPGIMVLILCASLGADIMLVARATPANAAASLDSTFVFKRTTDHAAPNFDMVQGYTPTDPGTTCPTARGAGWTCTWSSDTFVSGQSLSAGTATVTLHAENAVATIFHRGTTSGTNSGSSVTVAVPGGTATGDVLVARLFSSLGTAEIVTAPAGWTLIRKTATSNDTGRIDVYWRAATGSEPASYTWNGPPGNNKWHAAIGAYAGVDTASPIHAEAGQANGSVSTHPTPTITTTVSNAMLVATFGVLQSGQNFVTMPGDVTTRHNAKFDVYALGTGDATQAAAGSASRTATSSANGQSVTHILALRPAPRSCTITAEVLHNAAVIGSATAAVQSPQTTSAHTIPISIPSVAFADGDRLHVSVSVPNVADCVARTHFDGASVNSRMVTSTIVPERTLALLPLALLLPLLARRWWRRRDR